LAVLDLFSKGRKQELGEVPDVYTYTTLPKELRVQIIHAWRDALGTCRIDSTGNVTPAYHALAKVLRREYGQFSLVRGHYDSEDPNYSENEVTEFFLTTDTDRALDVVELVCRLIDRQCRSWGYLCRNNADEIATEALEQINKRFKEHGIGYQYSGERIIRLDSEILHTEAVRPALQMLSKPEYAGPQGEFLRAHEHYRHGRKSEALVESCKASESMMKAICHKRKWMYDKNATAKTLIEVCFKNGLIPQFWQSHFSALRTLLENAIPVPRNKRGGHGAGAVPANVPDEIVPYLLHMTAATILFLGEADGRIPK
jgi:hypothetical protein